MIDPCKNNNCDFYDSCPLRPLDLETHAELGGLKNLSPKPSFKIDKNGIGRLDICGPIGPATTDAALDTIAAMHRLKGVVAFFDSSGGLANPHQDLLLFCILYARRGVPVYGVVRRSLSAALTTAMCCSKVFAESDDAIFGCFGSMASFCNGRTPAILASSGSPFKLPGRDCMLGPAEYFEYTPRNLVVQQIELDKRYEKDLTSISKLRGVPESVLASGCLDGHVFPTRGAKYFDLIDGVATKEEVYHLLTQSLT